MAIESLPVKNTRLEALKANEGAVGLLLIAASFLAIPVAIAAIAHSRRIDSEAFAEKFLPRIRTAEEPGQPSK